MYDLERFVEAQERDYEIALREIRDGRKVSHWIWYVFPQLGGLGHSDRAKYYGIKDIHEAQAYLEHPVLGPRYLECVAAVLGHEGEGKRIEDIMGGSLDAKKLRSSLTLMRAAGGGALVEKALQALYGGKECTATLAILRDEKGATSR